MLLESDPFEPSWDVTSDSIAAYIAHRLKAAKTIFVTDVDGIYNEDPKRDANAELLSAVSVDGLLKFGKRTSVDLFLPKFLMQHPIDCYVANGNYPGRLSAILADQETVFTRIVFKV
jgi:aspartokinase-like uncharacterized kinase